MAKQSEDRRDLNVTGAHQELPDTSEALSNEIILLKINSALKDLGDSARYIKVPEYDQQITANLAGRKIVMVDDTVGQLTTWMPELIAATQGSAKYILHREQSIEQLVDQIAKISPDLVLLDYELARGIRGDDVLPIIRQQIPSVIIIGFSSSSSYNLNFKRAGADGIANKSSTQRSNELMSYLGGLLNSSEFKADNEIVVTQPEVIQPTQSRQINLREIFNKAITDQHIDCFVNVLSRCVEKRENSTNQEVNADELYKKIIDRLISECATPFEKLLVIASEKFYYDEAARLDLCLFDSHYEITIAALTSLKGFLPERISEVISQDQIISSDTNGRDFALLLRSDEKKRRIITLDKLIELHDVSGYKYLDISPSGEPFVRCVTSRHGGRAFFDGTHLMSHPSFQTCAPKVSFFEGGYIVNSTGCSIVNGRIYPLINEEDKVALTTGAWGGFVDCSLRDALDSYAQNEVLASKLSIGLDGTINIAGKSISPIGKFRPSKTKVLDNGFTLFEWAEYEQF